MKMGGFIGSITFEGDFEKFMPFLLLGEFIHVGKGTSFGLGKYKIKWQGLQMSISSFFSSFYFGDDDGFCFVVNPVDDSIITNPNTIEGSG